MRHRRPRRYTGQHRAALVTPRTRYGVVVGTALVGAGVVAFGAGTALPSPPSDVSTAALVVSQDKGAPEPSTAAEAELEVPEQEAAEETVARPAQVQKRASAPIPELLPIWTKPILGGYLSSMYGQRWGTLHAGVDFAAPQGTEVYAASDGVVETAAWYGGYGYAVIIDHGNGVKTVYGHNSALHVSPGQQVKAGDLIASVGSTGYSTGPHLHFEVRIYDEQVDPLPYLADRGVLM